MRKSRTKTHTIDDGIDNAVDNTGRVQIRMAIGYKDSMIYIRKIDRDLFFWDVVYQGQLYSNYIVIVPEEGKELEEEINHKATEMCYAGATATVDGLMGVELSDEDKKLVAMMESKRDVVEKEN